MAKRKRLTPANPMFLDTPAEAGPVPLRAAPISDVAREAATTAALNELSDTLARARTEGRMVLDIALAAVQRDHLVRDRIAADPEEMAALKASIQARGQQTPIEVADLGGGAYGLISGWRRLQALEQLHTETGEARFATVQALIRRPAEASEAYAAMVEENELRVGLSYYERARIVRKSVEQGVFDSERAALRGLFATASRAKRSKIGSFVRLVAELDGHLRFPQAIGERQGLMLAQAVGSDPVGGPCLRGALAEARPETPEAEARVMARAVAKLRQQIARDYPGRAGAPRPPALPADEALPGGVTLKTRANGRLELSGKAVTPDLRAALLDWLRARLDG